MNNDVFLGWSPSPLLIASAILLCLLALALVIIIRYKESRPVSAKTKASRFQVWTSLFSTTRCKAEIVGLYLGLVLQRKYAYLPSTKEFNALILGESGSGKSSSVIIPTLDHWPGGAFVIDCEGDLWKNALCKMRKLWSPVMPDSIPFNIFGHIDRLPTIQEKNTAIANMAHLLIPEVADDASEAARYFCRAGRAFLTAGMTVLYHGGHDFCRICREICSLDGVDYLEKISQSGNETAIRYIKAYQGSGERNIGACMTTCCDAIQIFATIDSLANTVRRPTLGEDCLEADMVENNAVFAYVPREDLELYSPLLRVILGQTLTYLASRQFTPEKAPILLVLDEFVTLGRMEKLINALRTFRKRGTRIMICTQCLADIDAVYGSNSRSSIVNNCTYKFVLGSSDTTTQEDISRLVGDHMVERVSVNTSSAGTSYSTHREAERIVPPAMLGRLKRNYLLLFPGGHIFIKKYPYFLYRKYKKPPVFLPRQNKRKR